MSILKKEVVRKKPQLDLTGPDGNAYVVLGVCRSIALQLHMDWEPIQKEAMSGDYEHLVKTLDSHFGDYIDFLR